MSPTVSANFELEQLVELAWRRGRLDLAGFRPGYLLRRLAIRQRRCDCPDLASYLERLRRDDQELERLRDVLSLGYTSFFRDPELYQALTERLLPERLAAGTGRLKLLSAGCASGEETWSLAITAAELLGPGRLADSLMVQGLDVDKKAVLTARRALYPATSVAPVSTRQRRRWFVSESRGERVVEELRRVTRFRSADLCREPVGSGYDLVLCRNVLIYLSSERHPRVVEALASALAPGGLLVLGRSERPPDSVRKRMSEVDTRLRVWRLQQPAVPTRRLA